MKIMATSSLIKRMAKASTLSNKTLGIQSSLKLLSGQGLARWLMADERILTRH